MSFSFARTRRQMRSSARPEDVARSLADPDGTLIAVWAHPDDATLVAGGLLSAAADAGIRVIQACAINGPCRNDSTNDVGEVEERVTLFDQLEEPCADVPKRTGVRAVQHLIDEYRPDTVVSFGPDGVTGDPDHRAVARWVARAVAAADRELHVAHVVTDVAARWPEDLVNRMHLAGSFWPGFPVRRPSADGIDVTIDGDALRDKVDALHEHTHFGPLHDELGEDGVRRLAEVESYAAVNDAAQYRLGSIASAELLAA